MSEKAVMTKLDDMLEPLGFTRNKAAWNRESGYVVEVIEVQISKAGDTATLNAGVLDKVVYVKLWGNEPPTFVEGPTCTVTARAGELIDGKDIWWRLDDVQVADEISEVIADHMIPFVKRMRSRQNMVQWLTNAQVVKRKYPSPIINLAILQNLIGNSAEGCALLAELQKKAIGAWRVKADEVAERLACKEPR